MKALILLMILSSCASTYTIQEPVFYSNTYIPELHYDLPVLKIMCIHHKGIEVPFTEVRGPNSWVPDYYGSKQCLERSLHPRRI